ncbi:pentapeptide repeat-containing protein [filamentous cyanobacterium LEGE 11480]|uniref:Pentapeptide repeat-containing protein n=1 Tax=Romeriopsis navalis LEGE 11480 TaxID=2777977 RepID=A0A928VT36_9CYAN|nr:pentapeptide repeat-containing protein [Romeriopsis navalis]MBE9032047.1 pentapeptide repeat-containing protein [Romeriopsis navalis LEGE 11480]
MNSEALLAQYDGGDRQFETVELTDAKLTHQKLPGINLRRAQLVGANFQGGDLALADFSQANLRSADLRYANLQRADLSEADLTGANLSDANLSAAQLSYTTLNYAELHQADLRHSNLSGASFVGAKLPGADLSNANLAGSDLRGAEFRQTKLDCANLRGANLQDANLRWADLSGADLSGADLSGATLSGATLTGANLSGTILIDAVFVHADLTRANLNEVDWSGADFTAAKMTGVKLHNTRPFGATFDGLECQWLDLSANGDHSTTFQFSSKNPYEYFYKAAPTVEIIIDGRLNTEGHSALAVIYQRLARQLKTALPTPHVLPDRKRTRLTFTLHRDEKLFLTAYTMMFPFTDAVISHQALVEQLRSITQECLQQSKPQMQAFQRMVTNLNQQRQKTIADAQLQSLAQSVQSVPFFQAPTRIIVTNSNAHRLVLYGNPTFGRRSSQMLASCLNSEQTVLQTSGGRLSRPSREEVIHFINRFRWSEHYLRGIAS